MEYVILNKCIWAAPHFLTHIWHEEIAFQPHKTSLKQGVGREPVGPMRQIRPPRIVWYSLCQSWSCLRLSNPSASCRKSVCKQLGLCCAKQNPSRFTSKHSPSAGPTDSPNRSRAAKAQIHHRSQEAPLYIWKSPLHLELGYPVIQRSCVMPNTT